LACAGHVGHAPLAHLLRGSLSAAMPLPPICAEGAVCVDGQADSDKISAAVAAAPCMALVPFKGRGKSKTAALRERILQGMAGRSAEEYQADMAERFRLVEERAKEAASLEATRVAEVDEAAAAYTAAKVNVQEEIERELTIVRESRRLKDEAADASRRASACRNSLFEAKKRLAMLEVLQMNRETVRRLREQREAALRAAQEAKQNLKDHRKRMLQEVGVATKPPAKMAKIAAEPALVAEGEEEVFAAVFSQPAEAPKSVDSTTEAAS